MTDPDDVSKIENMFESRPRMWTRSEGSCQRAGPYRDIVARSSTTLVVERRISGRNVLQPSSRVCAEVAFDGENLKNIKVR